MANDYISRDYAVENMENFPWDTEHDKNAAIHLVRELVPAADVVEVVRCKDCRYFHNGYDEKCCINHKGVVVTDENGFCHHAERRADDG